jgi:hypothetical protein
MSYLHRGLVHCCHICTRTRLIPARSAPGPGSSATCAPRTGLIPTIPALGLGAIFARTGHISAKFAPGPGSPCHFCRLQLCASICSICAHSLFICRSRFLRPSHSPPRPLPLPPITSRRGVPPLSSQSPLAFALDGGEAHFLRAARWAVRWVCRLTYASELSLFLPAQFGLSWLLVPWLLGWQHGLLAGSCALDHRSDHNQTAASTNPERKRIVGIPADISHVISLSTPRVVAGPPARAVIRRR